MAYPIASVEDDDTLVDTALSALPYIPLAYGGTDTGMVRAERGQLRRARPLGLFMVADGLGGAARGGGRLADRHRAGAARRRGRGHHLAARPGDAGPESGPRRFIAGIHHANRRILQQARQEHAKRGMGTTFAGLLLLSVAPWSRTWATAGLPAARRHPRPDDARPHPRQPPPRTGLAPARGGRPPPKRHVITRAVGTHESVEVDARDRGHPARRHLRRVQRRPPRAARRRGRSRASSSPTRTPSPPPASSSTGPTRRAGRQRDGGRRAARSRPRVAYARARHGNRAYQAVRVAQDRRRHVARGRRPAIYGALEVDATALLAFIERARAAGHRLTPTHLVGRALAHALRAVPDLNVRIVGGEAVARESVDIFFITVVGGGRDLSGVKVTGADAKTAYAVAADSRRPRPAPSSRARTPAFSPHQAPDGRPPHADPSARLLQLGVWLTGERGLAHPLPLPAREPVRQRHRLQPGVPFGLPLGFVPPPGGLDYKDPIIVVAGDRSADKPVAVAGKVEISPDAAHHRDHRPPLRRRLAHRPARQAFPRLPGRPRRVRAGAARGGVTGRRTAPARPTRTRPMPRPSPPDPRAEKEARHLAFFATRLVSPEAAAECGPTPRPCSRGRSSPPASATWSPRRPRDAPDAALTREVVERAARPLATPPPARLILPSCGPSRARSRPRSGLGGARAHGAPARRPGLLPERLLREIAGQDAIDEIIGTCCMTGSRSSRRR